MRVSKKRSVGAGQRANRPIRGVDPPPQLRRHHDQSSPTPELFCPIAVIRLQFCHHPLDNGHLNFQCAVPPASLGAYLIAW
jgi:hypothetical protein